MQPLSDGTQCGVHHVQPRPVLNVRYPVYMWQVPSQVGQLRLADALVPLPLVQINPLAMWLWIAGPIFVIGTIFALWPQPSLERRRRPTAQPATQ